ncbi:hypothetical protein EON81_02690 [bacterium]|nr:MAG: hypothetical protein EON81_02690 [bacterium]
MKPEVAYERWLIYEWSRRNGFSLAWLSVLGGFITGGATLSFLFNRDYFLKESLPFAVLLISVLAGILAMAPRALTLLRYRGRSDARHFWLRHRRDEGQIDRRLVRAAQDREQIVVLLKDGYLSREWTRAIVKEADLRMERAFDEVHGLSSIRLPAKHAEERLFADVEWLGGVSQAVERAVLGGPGALVAEEEGLAALRDHVGEKRSQLPANMQRISEPSASVYHAVEHLGRWLRVKHTQSQMLLTSLGCVAGYASVQAFKALEGNFDRSATIFGILGSLIAVTAIHFLWTRKRFRPDLDPWRQSYQKGQLAQKLGECAPSLEDAARNREEILLLAKHPAVPADLREEMAVEADRRMERAFDLSVRIAVVASVPRAVAEAQTTEDLTWLRNAREELETVTLPKSEISENGEDPLLRLRTLAAERQAALEELRA